MFIRALLPPLCTEHDPGLEVRNACSSDPFSLRFAPSMTMASRSEIHVHPTPSFSAGRAFLASLLLIAVVAIVVNGAPSKQMSDGYVMKRAAMHETCKSNGVKCRERPAKKGDFEMKCCRGYCKIIAGRNQGVCTAWQRPTGYTGYSG